MKRRHFIASIAALAALPGSAIRQLSANNDSTTETIEKIVLSSHEWRRRLSRERYDILRLAATERPFSSPLNKEKRVGQYVCAGCDLPLFESAMKFDSGTGWPSFFTTISNHVETKTDFALILPRTEYHCARCSGHQGHVFQDGPKPSGQRWCNNGLALRFIPA